LWKHYDCILVDEFQDISVDRYKFLQALRSDEPRTKLYCVGDDWQSIFRFTGSDMSLFYEFEKYFGHTELCKIETTYRFHQPLIDRSSEFIIKNKEQIRGIKESGVINTAVLDYVAENIKAGCTTEDIDKWVYSKTVELGAVPAPLNYEGFPKSVCTSLNNEVCHGIPSEDIILKDGDIINVDVSTNLNGYYSDSSRMFCIGDVSPEKRALVEAAKQALDEGLKEVKPWGFLGDMGQAVHDHCKAAGYSVVREIGGHGVGIEFHEDPWVSYVTKRGTEMLMVPGMMFTIEPMVNMGSNAIYTDPENDWEVYTADGLPSAQWELQVLVTEEGTEVISW
jgi:methionyl aminopeptidase